MTRSSTNELFTPLKDPEREFQSSKRYFKTLSLDELRSPDFNLFSAQENSEEEEVETMGQFLKELRTNTFSGSDHEDKNKHIEKVLKIMDLFHIPNITIDQVMLRAFPMSLTGAKIEEINNIQQEPDENLYQAWERFKELLMKCPQHYLTEMHEVVLFYNGLDVPTRQILDSRGAIPSKTAADAKTTIQEMAEYSQKWHNGTSRFRSTKTSDRLAAIQAQLNNLGREIKKVNEKVYAAQVGCEQCKGPHYTKDFPLKEERKTLQEAYYT
ncbi:reverse transcriptase domain-containing protein [Tanacetum coccineum]